MESLPTIASSASDIGLNRKPTRRRTAVLAALFCGLLLVSSWVTVAISGEGIEADLKRQALTALAGLENPRGGEWSIEFDGRDGSVRGEVYDRAFRDALVGRVRAIPGVRVLDDGYFHFRRKEDPWLSLAVNSKEKLLTVKGLLPASGGWKTQVLKTLHAPDKPGVAAEEDGGQAAPTDMTEWRVEDEGLQEHPDVFEPEWTDGVGTLVTVLVENPRAEMAVVRDARVTLEGAVFSEESRNALSIAVDAAFGESGFRTANAFRVIAPPEPPALSLVWGIGRDVTLTGTVADAEAKARLEAAIGNMLPPENRFRSELGVGENTAQAAWEEAVGMLVPGLVGDTKAGSFAVEGQQVRITGEMESEEMRESLREMAKQSFPEDGGYRFDIALTVHVPPRPAIMSVIHMAEAGVKLKGVVGEEATREAFVALAREQLAEGVPLDTEQIEIERNTMEPTWMPAFAGILSGFVENTTRGGLTVYENSLVIEAEVPTEAKWNAVWQLSENLFPDPDFTRDVQLKVVDPSLPAGEDSGPEDPDAFGAPEEPFRQ